MTNVSEVFSVQEKTTSIYISNKHENQETFRIESYYTTMCWRSRIPTSNSISVGNENLILLLFIVLLTFLSGVADV